MLDLELPFLCKNSINDIKNVYLPGGWQPSHHLEQEEILPECGRLEILQQSGQSQGGKLGYRTVEIGNAKQEEYYMA